MAPIPIATNGTEVQGDLPNENSPISYEFTAQKDKLYQVVAERGWNSPSSDFDLQVNNKDVLSYRIDDKLLEIYHGFLKSNGPTTVSISRIRTRRLDKYPYTVKVEEISAEPLTLNASAKEFQLQAGRMNLHSFTPTQAVDSYLVTVDSYDPGLRFLDADDTEISAKYDADTNRYTFAIDDTTTDIHIFAVDDWELNASEYTVAVKENSVDATTHDRSAFEPLSRGVEEVGWNATLGIRWGSFKAGTLDTYNQWVGHNIGAGRIRFGPDHDKDIKLIPAIRPYPGPHYHYDSTGRPPLQFSNTLADLSQVNSEKFDDPHNAISIDIPAAGTPSLVLFRQGSNNDYYYGVLKFIKIENDILEFRWVVGVKGVTDFSQAKEAQNYLNQVVEAEESTPGNHPLPNGTVVYFKDINNRMWKQGKILATASRGDIYIIDGLGPDENHRFAANFNDTQTEAPDDEVTPPTPLPPPPVEPGVDPMDQILNVLMEKNYPVTKLPFGTTEEKELYFRNLGSNHLLSVKQTGGSWKIEESVGRGSNWDHTARKSIKYVVIKDSSGHKRQVPYEDIKLASYSDFVKHNFTVANESGQQMMVNAHNQARANAPLKKQALNQVQWDNNLATYAQEWAELLMEYYILNRGYDWGDGRNPHRPRSNDRWHEAHKYALIYGENITMGKNPTTPSAVVEGWVDEKKYYNIRQNFCRRSPCGHYTQVVWNTSTKIGAGMVFFPGGTARGFVIKPRLIWVCNYNPAGNIQGQRPYEIT